MTMTSLVTPNIESLVPYETGKPIEDVARELGIPNAIKLASNENPLGPSPLALEAMGRHLADIHRYPDGAAYRLRERLSQTTGASMDEIIHGSGSSEIIDLLIRTFTTPEDHIVFGEPAFVMYRLTSVAHGTPFTAVPLRDQTHDLEAMAAAVTPRTKLMLVANPNNPTGTYVGRERMERLLRTLPEQVIVAVDEAYVEYADAPDFPNCLELRNLRERLVVMRTFSKAYGLAALRVGYGVAPSYLVNYMNRLRPPFNVSTLGQVAACAALDDHAHVERSRTLNNAERARLTTELSAMGLEVVPSQANFVYVDMKRPARPLYDALLRRGVIVRPFASLPTGLRITVGTVAENDRFLTELREVMS
jgi:histidinol-phosphate aminotransferase